MSVAIEAEDSSNAICSPTVSNEAEIIAMLRQEIHELQGQRCQEQGTVKGLAGQVEDLERTVMEKEREHSENTKLLLLEAAKASRNMVQPLQAKILELEEEIEQQGGARAQEEVNLDEQVEVIEHHAKAIEGHLAAARKNIRTLEQLNAELQDAFEQSIADVKVALYKAEANTIEHFAAHHGLTRRQTWDSSIAARSLRINTVADAATTHATAAADNSDEDVRAVVEGDEVLDVPHLPLEDGPGAVEPSAAGSDTAYQAQEITRGTFELPDALHQNASAPEWTSELGPLHHHVDQANIDATSKERFHVSLGMVEDEMTSLREECRFAFGKYTSEVVKHEATQQELSGLLAEYHDHPPAGWKPENLASLRDEAVEKLRRESARQAEELSRLTQRCKTLEHEYEQAVASHGQEVDALEKSLALMEHNTDALVTVNAELHTVAVEKVSDATIQQDLNAIGLPLHQTVQTTTELCIEALREAALLKHLRSRDQLKASLAADQLQKELDQKAEDVARLETSELDQSLLIRDLEGQLSDLGHAVKTAQRDHDSRMEQVEILMSLGLDERTHSRLDTMVQRIRGLGDDLHLAHKRLKEQAYHIKGLEMECGDMQMGAHTYNEEQAEKRRWLAHCEKLLVDHGIDAWEGMTYNPLDSFRKEE